MHHSLYELILGATLQSPRLSPISLGQVWLRVPLHELSLFSHYRETQAGKGEPVTQTPPEAVFSGDSSSDFEEKGWFDVPVDPGPIILMSEVLVSLFKVSSTLNSHNITHLAIEP